MFCWCASVHTVNVSLCPVSTQPSPFVNVSCIYVYVRVCLHERQKTTRVKNNRCLSSDHSHYIISASVTNNNDSVSTLSLKKKKPDRHVRGEFLYTSLSHKCNQLLRSLTFCCNYPRTLLCVCVDLSLSCHVFVILKLVKKKKN